MIDWKRGGWTGSLNSWVRREIHEHFRENDTARRTRYPIILRMLHRLFDRRSFGLFVGLYILFAICIALAEFGIVAYLPNWLPKWSGNTEIIKPLLTNVASYLITAQVGALGVISIAVGLVTLIAQREGASTDVKVYYHESMAFGVVASSISLLAVLCIQLLWPLQFTLHLLGQGTGQQFFKVMLTAAHLCWLLLNLFGLAHFVATTLAFVQQSAREDLRERYTTNVVLPFEMGKRLRETLYASAGPEMVKAYTPKDVKDGDAPMIYFGENFAQADMIEVAITSKKPVTVSDVRMIWIQWLVRRWLKRCRAVPDNKDGKQKRGLSKRTPLLMFPPQLDRPALNDAGLCRRQEGEPLTRVEKFIISKAFKFRKIRHEK
jgi:hypothetical protein